MDHGCAFSDLQEYHIPGGGTSNGARARIAYNTVNHMPNLQRRRADEISPRGVPNLNSPQPTSIALLLRGSSRGITDKLHLLPPPAPPHL